jgi:NAD dependent epimerase/dehydratase family enzyme
MKVLVTGSSGLIGSALIESLTANGHEAIRLLRTEFAEGLPFWDPENGVIDLGDVTGVDAVVHLAGYSIASGRWNERTKARILDSRVRGTKLLAEFFAESAHKPHVIVSGVERMSLMREVNLVRASWPMWPDNGRNLRPRPSRLAFEL